MSQRASSIRGKGAEILFGAPPTFEIRPRSTDLTWAEAEPSEQRAPRPDTPSHGGDLERAHHKKVRAGEPSPEEKQEDSPAPGLDPPLTPEMESALLEEAMGAGESRESAEGLAEPTLEVAMEEQNLMEQAALYEPPPPEVNDVTNGVLPPRRDRGVFAPGEAGTAPADIQAPEERVERLELPDRDLTEEEREQLLARLGNVRIQELDKEVDEMYDQVLATVGDNEQIATACYNELLKARDIILRRDAVKLPQVEYYIGQVRARLKRATDSEAAAKKYAWRIAAWGLFWFFVYTAVLILLSVDRFQEIIAPVSSGNLPLNMAIFLPAMIWGGIGGVAAVFYSLFKHVGGRDFDSQYNLSYMGKPFLGVILGATVYMVVHVLILALGIMPVGLLGTEEVSALVVMPWLIYLLAWACGFRENRIFDLIDRVIKQVFGGGETTPAGEPPG